MVLPAQRLARRAESHAKSTETQAKQPFSVLELIRGAATEAWPCLPSLLRHYARQRPGLLPHAAMPGRAHGPFESRKGLETAPERLPRGRTQALKRTPWHPGAASPSDPPPPSRTSPRASPRMLLASSKEAPEGRNVHLHPPEPQTTFASSNHLLTWLSELSSPRKASSKSASEGLLLHEVAVFLVIKLLEALDQTALALLHEVFELDHLSSKGSKDPCLSPPVLYFKSSLALFKMI